ncbi:TPA: hypothetical protein EYP26_05710 [Candidatus Bathyarchaeota archaeon]|nr:hypothetical protein [Candidatus Bathyarchaeota archaeon]
MLVDTGATYPALPEDVAERPGLASLGKVAKGKAKLKLSGLAIIRIEDRIAECPVIVKPKGTTPVIGVVALEQMDLGWIPRRGSSLKAYRQCRNISFSCR